MALPPYALRELQRGLSCVALLAATLPAQAGDAIVVPEAPFAAVRAMPAQPAVREGSKVTVQDADGRPLPDAVVVLTTIPSPSYGGRVSAAERAFPGDELRILAALATYGTRYRVDASGATRVPGTARGWLVAVHGDRLAAAVQSGEPSSKERTLTIRPPRSFRVRVLRADGTPAAGAPVALAAAPRAAAFPRMQADENGVAVFRVIDGRRPETAQVVARIAAPKPIQLPMPRGEGEQVTLQLPPCGSIRARLSEKALRGSDYAWSLRSRAGMMRNAVVDADDPTVARFPFVAVGAEGKIACSVDGRSGRSADYAMVTAGEELRVSVQASGPVLVARVLAPDGKPIRGRELECSWKHDFGTVTRRLRVNRQGWIQTIVPPAARNKAKLTLNWHADGPRSSLLGTKTIDVAYRNSRRDDRGTLRLEAPIAALTGRALDAFGKPVAGVRLSVSIDSSPGRFWAKTDADGRFVLNTSTKGQGLSVRIECDDYYWANVRNDRVAFQFGASDVRAEMLRAARVRCGADGLPDRFDQVIGVYCEDPDDSENRARLRFDWESPTFRMPSGTWDIVFLFGDREIHRIPKLVAETGIEVHDPRFMFFDWRSFLTLVTIRVQDESGKPTDECDISLITRKRAWNASPKEGVYRLLLPKDGGRLRITPKGRPSGDRIDLGVVTGDRIVRICCGPRLLVTLDAMPELPDGAQLLAEAGGVSQPFDAAGRAPLWLPQIDRWQVRLVVARGDQRIPVDVELPKADVPAGGATLARPLDDRLRRGIRAAVSKLR